VLTNPTRLTIAVDFDGTIVEHKFPEIGKEVPASTRTLKELQERGHRIILWTMRSGSTLQEAIDWCAHRGLYFYSVNQNPNQNSWTQSPKAYAHIYIDDAALGCPLTHHKGQRPYVDWLLVRKHLRAIGLIPNDR